MPVIVGALQSTWAALGRCPGQTTSYVAGALPQGENCRFYAKMWRGRATSLPRASDAKREHAASERWGSTGQAPFTQGTTLVLQLSLETQIELENSL